MKKQPELREQSNQTATDIDNQLHFHSRKTKACEQKKWRNT